MRAMSIRTPLLAGRLLLIPIALAHVARRR